MERKACPLYPKAAETVSIKEFNMKPKCRHNSDRILSSLSLPASSFGTANLVLIILTTLATSCEAQSSSGAGLSFSVLIPVVAVSVVGCVFFIICICVCATICYATSHATHSQSRITTQTVWQQRNQLPPGRPVPAGGLSYPVQRQRHSAQISRAPYPSSNTVPEEPVSLPEATLHHGDAPPGYEEAIRMKTIDGNVVAS